MTWRVVVKYKPEVIDHRGKKLLTEWKHTCLGDMKKITTAQVYELWGDLKPGDIGIMAEKLLSDPITQSAVVIAVPETKPEGKIVSVRIWPKNGVTDPVADTVKIGAEDLKIGKLERVRSGHAYDFVGTAPRRIVQSFCEEHLMNTLVQTLELL